MAKRLSVPFGQYSDLVNDIPDSTSELGVASYLKGFGAETMKPITEGGIAPDGKDFNGIFHDITSNIVDLNKGIPQTFNQDYANKIQGYPLHSRLVLDDGETIVISKVSNNTSNPNTDMSKWVLQSDKTLVTWTGANQQFENKSSLTSCYDLSGLRALSVTTDRTCFVVAEAVRGLWLYIDWLNKYDNGATIVKSKFGGCWLFVGRMNNTNDIRTMGAVGDGIADDTEYVRQALNNGVTRFVGDAVYKVTDVELVRKLSTTMGDGVLLYNGTKYPFGDIVNFGVGMAVPSVFYNIQYCFDWLKSKRIKNGEAFIKVEDGNYKQDFENVVEHIDGALIKIIGNESDPSKCHFDFDNSNNRNFFHMTKPLSIGFINGFEVKGISGKGSGDGEWNKDIFGAMVRAINGGMITCGHAMRSIDMYYGVQAKYGATINAEYYPPDNNPNGGGFYVSGAGDCGFHAFGATIRCNGAEAHNTYDAGSDLGFGFCAESGGFIECEYSFATGNRRAGFYTLSAGSMWAHAVKATGNKFGALCWGGHMEINSTPTRKTQLTGNEKGLYATQKGQVGANGTICTGNSVAGFHAELGSVIDINGTTGSNNGISTIDPRSGDGYLATLGGKLLGGGIKAQGNARNGLRADTDGYIYTENFNISDHSYSENVKALNMGRIIAKGLPSYITTSPKRNTIGNNGAVIYDNVVA